MSEPSTMTRGLAATLTVVGTAIGIVAGSMTMWFSLKDRMETEIEAKISERIKTESRLARHDEKIKSLESDVWTLKQAKP